MRTDRYRKKYLRWHKTYEKRTAKELQSVFRRWASSLQLSGSPDQWVNQMDSTFTEEDLFKAYVNIYTEIGIVHGSRVGNSINKSQKDFNPEFFKEVYRRYVALYLQRSVLQRIFEIRSTFIDFLSTMLMSRWNQGLFGDSPDPSRVADWIHKESRKRTFYRWQALRIARTESTAASNLGGLKAAKESGFVMDKIWVSALDPRTRRHPKDWYDHAEMHNKSVRMDEKFTMPSTKGGLDELEFPGDPKAHPANTINCRCTLIYKPRKANGRLVRQ